MKKSRLVLVFAMFLSFIAFSCQEAKGQSVSHKLDEPQLVWQKEFGVGIQYIKLHDEVGPTHFPVRFVYTKDALVVFDKEGTEVEKRKRPVYRTEINGKEVTYKGYLILSDNGKYILEGRAILEISLDLKYTTIDGKVLWKKKGFSGMAKILSNGNVIVLFNYKGGKDKKGSIEFYDKYGKLFKQHFIDIRGIKDFYYDLVLSRDGNYLFLQVDQWIENDEGRKVIHPFFLFNKKGDLLLQKNIETISGKKPKIQLLISHHGNKIAYSNDQFIYVIDQMGNFLWKNKFHNLNYFSYDENMLVMRNKEKVFFIVDSLEGNILWSTDKGYPILAPDNSLIAIKERTDENDGRIIDLYAVKMIDDKNNMKRSLIMRRKYTHPIKVIFQFSSDSKQIHYIEQSEESKLSVYRLAVPIN
jgi:hypothetical protein